eukprot:NODE_2413_length_939_cov_345.361991.p2 GENE.NODE_2413_length_939_cov_345.361991~~NODE_2413_length_939_cov_345.361991.p2  ORF type:complete len:307 (+),score=166.49 NODE_2413_length_939_cov_345.361991:34-921(+)
MVENLRKSQVADDSKRTWCQQNLASTGDAKAALERAIADLGSQSEAGEQAMAQLQEELKALQDGVAALDKAVAEATEQRKAENAAYTELMAGNTAAKGLLGVAKNRLNQFYNPRLFKEAEKAELTKMGRISENHAAFVQLSEEVAPPPAPATFGTYEKKHEDSNGVIAMIDLLKKELDKEMTEAKTDEDHSQAAYEQLMADSAAKRGADTKSITDKMESKAALASTQQAFADKSASLEKKLGVKNEYLRTLHAECDWLLANYDTRKETRASEINALGNAKSVLNGADYTLAQTSA